jgi:hypothetical protein
MQTSFFLAAMSEARPVTYLSNRQVLLLVFDINADLLSLPNPHNIEKINVSSFEDKGKISLTSDPSISLRYFDLSRAESHNVIVAGNAIRETITKFNIKDLMAPPIVETYLMHNSDDSMAADDMDNIGNVNCDMVYEINRILIEFYPSYVLSDPTFVLKYEYYYE